MGLDGVELVIRFEEEFGLAIPDEDAAVMYTPRDVIDYLMARLSVVHAQSCRTQQCFHRVRRALMATLGLQRGDVRPETALAAIVPKAQRRAWWTALGARLGAAEWPGLVLSARQWSAGCLLSLCGSVAVGWWVWVVAPWRALGILAGIAALVPIVYAYGAIMALWRRSFPAGMATAGGLSRALAAHVDPANGRWTREDVALRVERLVRDQIGVSDRDYDENKRFVQDFGMD